MIDLERPEALALYNALGLDLSDDEFERLYPIMRATALTPTAFAFLIREGVNLEKERQSRYECERQKS